MRRPPGNPPLLLATALALALVLLTAAPGRAAEGDGLGATLHIESVDTSQFPNVSMTISVPRSLVGTDLDAEAFTLSEDGQVRPVSVRRIPNEDLEVALVLDTSGSMQGDPLREAKAAALDFVDQMPPGVRIAVVGFGDHPVVVSEFSTDVAATRAAVTSLGAAGETALYDGLVTAAALFGSTEGSRRSVVLLSDGGDTVSEQDLEKAIVAVIDANADFYAVELQTYESDPEALTRLGAAAAGQVVPATNPGALSGIFDEIASKLVNQYVLDYSSAASGSTEIFVSAAADGTITETVYSIQLPPAPTPPVEAPLPAPEASPITVPAPIPEEVAPPVSSPKPVTVAAVLGNPWVLFGGAAAVFAAVVILIVLAQTSERRVHLLGRAERKAARGNRSAMTGVADRAVIFAENALQSRGRQRRLAGTLEQAGIKLRPGEFAVLAVSTALAAYAAGTVLAGPLLGLALTVATIVVIRLGLGRKANRRQAAFAEQLPDNLQLLAGSVRAGYGLVQAIDAVSQEALSPSAEEFRRLVVEVNLGRDLNEALTAAAARVRSTDFEWVVEAMEINREVGGDLAEVLGQVGTTIRDRNQIRRKVDALSAEGRLSAIILIALPFLAGAVISVTNPDYLTELTGTSFGRVLIGVGLVLMALGTVWMKRIVKLVY